MFGWGRLSRPSPPQASPQPVTTARPMLPPLSGARPPAGVTLVQQQPAAAQTLTAPFVSRIPDRRSITYYYQYGAMNMPITVPYPGGADGQVWRSRFQPYVRRLTTAAPSRSFMRMVFPTNRGATFRAAAPSTQTTGGPGPGRMQGKPIFGRVQNIPRASRTVPAYNTQSSPA